MQISPKITCVLQISPNDVDVSVQVFCSNMTMLGPILPVQLLTIIQDLSFGCLPRPPYSPDLAPPATSMLLNSTKMRWEASLSGPTKRCSRRCTSGRTLSQNNLFSRGIHALPKRWNTYMEDNEDYMEK